MSTPTPPALYKAIICVDIEGFSSPHIADWQRADMLSGLYGALESAFGKSGIPWDECYDEDRGDGAFFLVNPDVPKARLVDPLPFELAAELGRYNQTADEKSGIRVRLRVAIHAGDVSVVKKGVVGTPLNLAFRLLDAPALKSALRDASGDLAIIVSESFYEEVVQRRRGLDLSTYRQVPVSVKETDVEAWICTSGIQLEAGKQAGEGAARIEATLAVIDDTLAKARRERVVAAAKIASPLHDIPDLAGCLRDRLRALGRPREEHRWSELITAVAELEQATDRALGEARDVHRATRALLDQREELRGLLRSYQAMACAAGRAEQRRLDELYQRAHDLLWTAPCELRQAEVATMDYVRAVQEE